MGVRKKPRKWVRPTLIILTSMVVIVALSVIGARLLVGGDTKFGPLPALGTTADNPEELQQMLLDMGRTKISVNTSYMNDTDGVSTTMLDAETQAGVTTHIITLEIQDTLANIRSGKRDSNLGRIGRQLGQWQTLHPTHQIIVRPLHEANGNWYNWGFGAGNKYGNTKDQFIPAWRHVHGVLKYRFPGLKFFWCPSGLIAGSSETSYAGWYPGDSSVDYVGDDKYNRSTSKGGNTWRMPTALHAPTIAAIRDVAPNRPYIVGEVATSEPSPGAASHGHTKAEWFTDFGPWLKGEVRKHGVVIVCYFDYDKLQLNGNDWRIYPNARTYTYGGKTSTSQAQPGAEESRVAFQKAIAGIP